MLTRPHIHSGGNLAAISTHKAAELGIPLAFQLLVVPVVDNTAQVEDSRYPSWKENHRTVSLVAPKMLWFRHNWTPDPADHTKWDNSPIFAPEELFKKSPPAWIAVAELDILRDEGIAYGEKLKKAGVAADVKVYVGAPHPIMAMDGWVLPFRFFKRCLTNPQPVPLKWVKSLSPMPQMRCAKHSTIDDRFGAVMNITWSYGRPRRIAKSVSICIMSLSAS